MDFTAEYEQMMASNHALETIRELFPDPLRRKAFKDWVLNKARERMPKILTRDELVAEVDNGNFLEAHFLNKLYGLLFAESIPILPVGRDGHFDYRLVIEQWSMGLQPATPLSDLDPAKQLTPYMLAFGTTYDNRQPPGRFIFYQLGRLEYRPRQAAQEPKSNATRHFDETGFYVVVRVGSTGRADGIYAVYNMNPLVDEDYLGGDGDDEDSWGRLPTPPGSSDEESTQFFCARLGDNLGVLGEEHCLDWENSVFSTEPLRLVPVDRECLLSGR